MQAESIVEYLCREKSCPREEAESVAGLLDHSPVSDAAGEKRRAAALWEELFNRRTRNFGLSKPDFDTLAEKLRNGDPALFEHVFLRHFTDCRGYLVHQQGIEPAMAYDVTMNTLLDFRRMLLENRLEYGNLRYLFTRMAVLAARKMRARGARLQPIETLGTEAPSPEPTEAIDAESLELFGRAWQRLGDECRRLLQAFYYDRQPWRAIAATFQLSEDNARKKGQRCRESLHELVKLYL